MKKPPFFVGHLPFEMKPDQAAGIILSAPFLSVNQPSAGPSCFVRLVNDRTTLKFEAPLKLLQQMGTLHEVTQIPRGNGVWIMTCDQDCEGPLVIPMPPENTPIKKFFLRATDLGQPETFEMIGSMDDRLVSLRLDGNYYRRVIHRLFQLGQNLSVQV